MVVRTQAHLFTTDIDSLYTNISTTHGLQIICSIFHRFPEPGRPAEELLQQLTKNVCLTKNDFTFNGKHFLQVRETTMGQRFALSYANI